jgi:hypothetical protein
MVFEKEFKEALLNLPLKEKDKLLLRLLKRDVPLANQLHFELISTQTMEERRVELEEMVLSRVEKMSKSSFGRQDLLLGIRSLSGEITKQVKITKDKMGEISLNLLMLQEVLKLNSPKIDMYTRVKAFKFGNYTISRVYKLLVLIQAMHEDYRADFRADLENLGELLEANELLKNAAMQYGLDLDWLISGEIPENIKQRQSTGMKK